MSVYLAPLAPRSGQEGYVRVFHRRHIGVRLLHTGFRIRLASLKLVLVRVLSGFLLLSGLLVGSSAPAQLAGVTHVRAFYDLAQPHQVATAYTPGRIQTAYGFTPLYTAGIDGTGQTIALMELDRLNPGDIATFDVSYGLKDIAIQEFYSGGTPFDLEHSDETSLDVEWAHALAPGATIQVYYVNDRGSLADSWRSLGQALRMAADNGASIVSVSLGACNPGTGLTNARDALATLVQRGVSVFVSSGDDGDKAGPVRECGNKPGVGYPSGDPSAVSVGGTSLQLNLDDTISREVAWKFSGGGRFKKLPHAPWEHAATMHKDTYRWVPDVAYLGDPKTGVNFVRFGTWRQVGGTSLGAPAWAATWALIRQKAAQQGVTLSAAPRLLYRVGNSKKYASAFHDIVVGTNGRYHAGPGWDPVTGWGSPNVAGLAAAVTSIASPH